MLPFQQAPFRYFIYAVSCCSTHTFTVSWYFLLLFLFLSRYVEGCKFIANFTAKNTKFHKELTLRCSIKFKIINSTICDDVFVRLLLLFYALLVCFCYFFKQMLKFILMLQRTVNYRVSLSELNRNYRKFQGLVIGRLLYFTLYRPTATIYQQPIGSHASKNKVK